MSLQAQAQEPGKPVLSWFSALSYALILLRDSEDYILPPCCAHRFHKTGCFLSPVLKMLLCPHLRTADRSWTPSAGTRRDPASLYRCSIPFFASPFSTKLKCINPMQVMAFSGQCNTVLKMFLTAFFRCPSHAF